MRNTSAEPKVNHFDNCLGLVQQDIFQFHIPMRHIPLVAIVDRLYHLNPQELGFEFGHLTIWLHLEVAVQ